MAQYGDCPYELIIIRVSVFVGRVVAPAHNKPMHRFMVERVFAPTKHMNIGQNIVLRRASYYTRIERIKR